MDNYATHKHHKVAHLADGAAKIPDSTHVHLLVVAQSGVCVDHAASDSPSLIPQGQGTGREKIDPLFGITIVLINHSSGPRLPDSVPHIDFPPDFRYLIPSEQR